MKKRCAVKCNNHSSMDRVYLEGWLLSNRIDYSIGKRGDLMCSLTAEQVDDLRSEGWPVVVLW